MQIGYVDSPDGGRYRPGACNIGPAEIRARRIAGIIGFAAAGVLATALVALEAPPAARWLVALPLIGGFTGILQAQLRFCANYGFRGLRNFGSLGRQEAVADAEARAADRRKALLIVGASTVLGILATIPIVLLPV
jgi:hypothetical protein